MNPQPKQLALLISLIGVGVSPGAWARSEFRGIGATLSSQTPVLEGSLSASLDPSARTADLVNDLIADPIGLPPSDAHEVAGISAAWLLYTAPGEDWGPGESPGTPGATDGLAHREPVEPATPSAARLADAPIEASVLPPSKRASAGKTRRVRVLVQAPGAAPAPDKAFATSDGPVIERSARVQWEPAPAPPPAPTPEDDVLERLAAVLLDTSRFETAAEQEPAGRVEAAVAAEPGRARRMHEASAAHLERAEIIVDTETGKVLRTLDAIRYGERDEVGAVKVDPAETVVTSQSDKVMTMLGEISSTRPAEVDVDVVLPLEVQAARPRRVADDSAPRVRTSPFGGQRLAVSEQALDGVRGGFVGDGLNISFGIERAVYINGVLVTTTSLNLSDLGRITAGRGTTSFDAGTIGLIQSGAGNLVTPGAISSAAIGTVVQNTLDGQKIQSITVINASVNSLGILRNLNLQSSLRSAVIDSLRR